MCHPGSVLVTSLGVASVGLEDAYRAWAADLVAFASTITGHDAAADAVAEVFQRLLADPSRWESVRDPRRYLFRCVVNAARASGRSDGRRRVREDRVWSSEVRHRRRDVGELSVLVDDRIGAAVAALSPQQRSIVFLTYWLDEPVPQVAEILGVRPGTVRRQLARARARLRGELS